MWQLKKISLENIDRVLDFLKQHERFCLDLTEQILTQAKELKSKTNSKKFISFIFLQDKTVIGVFGLEKNKTFLHCFPNPDPKNIEAFFICSKKFFYKIKFKFIIGEKNFSFLIKKYLTENLNYTVIKQNEYFLLSKTAEQKNSFYRLEFRIKTLMKKSNLQFSVCTTKDIEKLLPLELGYEREELELKRLNETYSRIYLQKMLREQTVFKCELNGCAIARVHTNASGINCKQLGGIYTAPNFRRLGIAEKLLTYAMEVLSARTKTFVLFVKVKNNSALNLYRKLGFKKFSEFTIIEFKSE